MARNIRTGRALSTNPKAVRLRQWRRETGRTGDGSAELAQAGQARGMEDLFQALQELSNGVQIRVRRKALQQTAQHLTRAAKASVSQYQLPTKAKQTLRRAIHRQDPKTRVVNIRVKKGQKRPLDASGRPRQFIQRRQRPMIYRVSVHTGMKNRSVEEGGERKRGRDAYWWAWPEKGTADRTTKGKGRRGRVVGQHVLKRAFDSSHRAASAAGEAAGFQQLEKEIKKLEAKAKSKTSKALKAA